MVRNHPFTDGNKRIALTVAGVFMELNGFRLQASEQDAAQAVRALAAREITEEQFAAWLQLTSSKPKTALRPVRQSTAALRRRRKRK
jgi:death-on-curing protein